MIKPNLQFEFSLSPARTKGSCRGAEGRGWNVLVGEEVEESLPPSRNVALPYSHLFTLFFPLTKARLRLMESRGKDHVALGIRQISVFQAEFCHCLPMCQVS